MPIAVSMLQIVDEEAKEKALLKKDELMFVDSGFKEMFLCAPCDDEAAPPPGARLLEYAHLGAVCAWLLFTRRACCRRPKA